MIKNYLWMAALLIEGAVFGQTNLIEQYSFKDGSLIGEQGTADYTGSGSTYTFTEDHEGNANRAYNFDGNAKTPLATVTTDASTGLTISFWAKPGNELPSQFSVMGTRNVCNWGNFMDIVGNTINNEIVGGFRTTNQKSAFVGLPFTVDTWAKYTFVYDNDAKHVFGYLNGVKTDSTAYKDGQNPIALTANGFGISNSACVGVDGTGRYKGALDQVEIYDRALTESEIVNMANFPGRENVLAAEFPMDFPPYANRIDDSEGVAENAIELDGSEAVNLGNPTLDPSNGFAVSLWLKPSSTNSGQFSVLSKRSVCSWDNMLEIVGNADLGVISGGFRTSSQRSSFVRVDYTENEWNHLVYIFDNATKKLYAYLNGNPVDTTAYTDGVAPTSFAPSTQLSIAGSPCVGTDVTVRYKGGIDEIALYDGVLTSQEISDLYDEGLVTGISNSTENNLLSIFPNPTSTEVSVPKGKVVIYNVQGEEVLRTVSTGNLNVSELKTGLYLIFQNGKRAQLIIE